MSTIGTFGTFTAARLGIYAAQKALSVVGNNISNINTTGYTRQRLEQSSLKTGGADRFASVYDVKIGSGVMVTGVSQIRDPYLDIRFRTELSSVGFADHKLSGLKDISDVIDETGKGENKGDGQLFAGLSDFLTSLENLDADAGAESNDTLARASADNLINLFHYFANDLEDLRGNAIDALHQDVDAVNTILGQIRDLNTAIRKSDIHGDPALELRDERNNLIDELSSYMKIDVIYTMEDVGAGQQVEHLTIQLANANPDPEVETDSTVLVNGIYSRELSLPDSFPTENDQYDPDYIPADPDNINPTADIKYFRYLKADGTGTNDPAEAAQIENDNYDLTLGKLLDSNGREWSEMVSSSVKKLDTPPPGAPSKAVYEYTVTSDKNWEEGDKIVISGRTFTVGRSLRKDTANDDEKLAAFIANNLDSTDYKVTSDGNKLIFTAHRAGAVGGDGPKADPGLTLTPGDPAQNGGVTLTQGTFDAGADSTPPFSYYAVQDNGDGTKDSISYSQRGTTWYAASIRTQYSQEVRLDDNDLYGSLQADREFLTEAGEFATTDTIQNVDESAAIKRGLPYYQKSLDLLARVFAETFNKANQGYAVDHNGDYLDKDGKTIQLEGDPINQDTLTDDQKIKLLQDFLTANNFGGLNENGELLDTAGELITLDGDPVAAAVRPDGVSDADWTAFVTAVKSVDANGNFADAAGNPLSLPDGTAFSLADAVLTADQQKEIVYDYLSDNEGDFLGGNLFSNRGDVDDAEGITASNIDISHSWATGDIHIVTTFTKLFGGDVTNTTQGDNVGHMISLMGAKLLYNPQDLVEGADSSHLFEGSFHDMLVKTCSVLGNDRRGTNTQLETHYTYSIEMETSRDSVSAVDLNDEAMNMMQYSKALTAAYRLLTTIDEALERLISNTGVVGR